MQSMLFHSKPVTAVQFTADGSIMISADEGGHVIFTMVRHLLECHVAVIVCVILLQALW